VWTAEVEQLAWHHLVLVFVFLERGGVLDGHVFHRSAMWQTFVAIDIDHYDLYLCIGNITRRINLHLSMLWSHPRQNAYVENDDYGINFSIQFAEVQTEYP